MATNKKRPTWKQFKAQLEVAIKDVVKAQNAMNDAQAQLTQAQKRLRDLTDTPPGQIPDVG
jgi:outer membrane protein TolC